MDQNFNAQAWTVIGSNPCQILAVTLQCYKLDLKLQIDVARSSTESRH